MSAVFKTGSGGRPGSHKRTRRTQGEIDAARADLARIDQVDDEVMDVVVRRLWDALGLDAELERMRQAKAAGRDAAPRELGSFEVHVKSETVGAVSDRSHLSAR